MEGNLAEYLAHIADLETSIYIQQRVVLQLKSQTDHLAIPSKVREPGPFVEYVPDYSRGNGFFVLWGMLLGGIVGFLLFLPWVWIALGALLGLGWSLFRNSRSAVEENRKLKEAYHSDKARYEKECAAERLRMEQEAARKHDLRDTISKMEDIQRDANLLLKQFYRLELLPPEGAETKVIPEADRVVEALVNAAVCHPDGAPELAAYFTQQAALLDSHRQWLENNEP